jgi:plastocyanin
MRFALRWWSFVVLCLLAVGAGVVVVAARAGGSTAASGPQVFHVNVDGKNKRANEAFIAYFPHVVRVHPGDTVVFHWAGNGEPHTVTLGTLADDAISAFARLKPAQQQNPPASVLAIDAKVPQLLPQGPGDAVQSGANTCYLAAGQVPGTAACAKVAQPSFDGTQSYYNSGWLDSKANFTVHISPGTRPGTYRFFCLLHRYGMVGKVVVVPSTQPVPTPSQQLALGRRQIAATEARLASAVAAERAGKLPLPITPPGKHIVLAGSGSPAVQEASITEFGPRVIHLPVGGSVIWYLFGPHTITFHSNRTNDDIRTTAPDGSVHLNVPALIPAGGPGEPSHPPRGGSQTHPKFQVVAATHWNGKGFLSSGIFGNSFGPPLIEGYRITFTHAGSYSYLCTVHDDMRGKVVVG